MNTYATLLTPPGRAAVATILVDGEHATRLTGTLFHSTVTQGLTQSPTGRILFGRWRVAEGSAEEVVLCRRSQQRIEVNCHGGRAAARAILKSLTDAGCQEVDWKSWLHQRGSDPIRAEAHIALSSAQTQRTARILLDQYDGALRTSLERILADLTSHEQTSAVEKLERLLSASPVGLHLTEPWRVALAGPPNVGKSSLINAIVGYHRAIVHDSPGTTRDVVTATTAFDGWLVELADMAGLRITADQLEKAGIAQARRRLEEADVTVLVFDLTRPWTDADKQLAASYPDALVVQNKNDLVPATTETSRPGLKTSAVTDEGIAELIVQLTRRLVPHVPPAGSAIPFTRPQVELLNQSVAAAKRQDFAAAIAPLRRLLAPSTQ